MSGGDYGSGYERWWLVAAGVGSGNGLGVFVWEKRDTKRERKR